MRNSFDLLRSALADIEARCGSPGSVRMSERRDIYEIARDALERIGLPSSPFYVADGDRGLAAAGALERIKELETENEQLKAENKQLRRTVFTINSEGLLSITEKPESETS